MSLFLYATRHHTTELGAVEIFLHAGEGKAVRPGRMCIEDSPPHDMKISRPETPSTKARYTSTRARYAQFQVLETFMF